MEGSQVLSKQADKAERRGFEAQGNGRQESRMVAKGPVEGGRNCRDRATAIIEDI
jgi:hypothetical protein